MITIRFSEVWLVDIVLVIHWSVLKIRFCTGNAAEARLHIRLQIRFLKNVDVSGFSHQFCNDFTDIVNDQMSLEMDRKLLNRLSVSILWQLMQNFQYFFRTKSLFSQIINQIYIDHFDQIFN